MKNKINKKQKAFVDQLFKNGFNQTEAYCVVYNIENRDYGRIGGSRMLTKDNVKAYYEHLYKEYRKSLDIDKQKMLDSLMDDINLYDEVKVLGRKENLSKNEQERLVRLKGIVSASDANKARDMINKLIGSYEPEKQEIEHTGMVFNYITPTEEKEEDKNNDNKL